MTDYRDVMLDLETYGTGRDAAIASIGAVRFDLERGEVGDATQRYHARIDLDKSRSPGVFTAATVEWWLRQSDAARQALVAGDRVPLEQALATFCLWARPSTNVNVWSCGANFDEVVLGDACTRHGITFPFKFWKSRCFRTLKELGKARGCREPDREGLAHDALGDAIHQARWACLVWKALRGTPCEKFP